MCPGNTVIIIVIADMSIITLEIPCKILPTIENATNIFSFFKKPIKLINRFKED